MSMSVVKRAVSKAYALYEDEFGSGYDRTSFVDFVLVQLHNPPGDVRGLIAWYRERAAELERWANKVPCRFQMPDGTISGYWLNVPDEVQAEVFPRALAAAKNLGAVAVWCEPHSTDPTTTVIE